MKKCSMYEKLKNHELMPQMASPVILFPLGLLIADPRDERNQTYRDTVEPPMGYWRDGNSLFKCVKCLPDPI